MYLTGKSHRFISVHECIISVEKSWDFFFFTISKNINYKCEFCNAEPTYPTQFKFFKCDGISIDVDSYENYILDMYTQYICKDLKKDGIILRDIRKEKLKNINENVNRKRRQSTKIKINK